MAKAFVLGSGDLRALRDVMQRVRNTQANNLPQEPDSLPKGHNYIHIVQAEEEIAPADPITGAVGLTEDVQIYRIDSDDFGAEVPDAKIHKLYHLGCEPIPIGTPFLAAMINFGNWLAIPISTEIIFLLAEDLVNDPANPTDPHEASAAWMEWDSAQEKYVAVYTITVTDYFRRCAEMYTYGKARLRVNSLGELIWDVMELWPVPYPTMIYATASADFTGSIIYLTADSIQVLAPYGGFFGSVRAKPTNVQNPFGWSGSSGAVVVAVWGGASSKVWKAIQVTCPEE